MLPSCGPVVPRLRRAGNYNAAAIFPILDRKPAVMTQPAVDHHILDTLGLIPWKISKGVENKLNNCHQANEILALQRPPSYLGENLISFIHNAVDQNKEVIVTGDFALPPLWCLWDKCWRWFPMWILFWRFLFGIFSLDGVLTMTGTECCDFDIKTEKTEMARWECGSWVWVSTNCSVFVYFFGPAFLLKRIGKNFD